MEEIKSVETANTQNNAGVEKIETPKREERTFTQKDLNTIVEKRISRAKKEWESKKQPEPEKPKESKSEVFELQKQLAKYEKELALSKYQIDDRDKDYVEFKVLRAVNKDKNYETALNEFFTDEANKRYLKNSGSMPRPANIGTTQSDPIKSKYGNVKPLNKGRI